MAMGQVVVVLPASQQTSRTVDAGRGVSVDDELLNKSLGVRLANCCSSLRPGASTSGVLYRCIIPVGNARIGGRRSRERGDLASAFSRRALRSRERRWLNVRE